MGSTRKDTRPPSYVAVDARAYDSLVRAAAAAGALNGRDNRWAHELRLWDWVAVTDRRLHKGEPRPKASHMAERWACSRSVASRFMASNADEAADLAARLGLKWDRTPSTRTPHTEHTPTAHRAHSSTQDEPAHSTNTAHPPHTEHTETATPPHADRPHARRATPTPTPTQEERGAPTLPLAPSSATPDGAASGVLSDRARAALRRHNLTPAILKSHTASSLLKLDGVGKKTVEEVEAFLSARGERLKPEPETPGKLAHRFRQVWSDAYLEVTGESYVYTSGDIHQTSKHIATSLDPDRWEPAIRAYLKACRAGEVWQHRDSKPSMHAFGGGLTEWASRAKEPPVSALDPSAVDRMRAAAAEHNARWHKLPKLPPIPGRGKRKGVDDAP